ncbi:hypothetical protein IE077_004474 [Cardiosporidium cionae]|uniref:Uncharacterized protein n=1 Tax=Cardiosporidium cionae TaxID=476202 RepID=A0ABQ7JA07_9APIC|nr:hypothetical protein IE077_004474 [Cardiosporidium cionae]|eukprot:KAF8820495.1 hypothetical protein IE077_004474 [Cardiosporidium cionae]
MSQQGEEDEEPEGQTIDYFLNLVEDEEPVRGAVISSPRLSLEYSTNEAGRGSYTDALRLNYTDAVKTRDMEKIIAGGEQKAEVVILATSFGGIRKQFFSSKRALSFLYCKGVAYYYIDTNRDFSKAKNLRDNELFQTWKSEQILQFTSTSSSSSPEVMIPQILIDGVSIGGETELQDLEEDGDLDWIFARLACPSCLCEKDMEIVSCPNCGTVLTSLIPPEAANDGSVQLFVQDQLCNGTEDESVSEISSLTTLKSGIRRGSTYNYEQVFGDLPLEE